MKYRITVIALLALFIASPAAALSFDVSIGALADTEAHFVQYHENTSAVQDVNVSVENTGSVGCVYRLKAEFRYRNQTQTRYSRPYPLFPNEMANARLHFIPENYTGPVEASLYSTYCGQQKSVENITFRSLRSNTAENSIESRVVSADEDSATVELEESGGLLVPRQTPPYWKASSARIKEGRATLRYSPPIFTRELLNYTVVRNGSITGYTTVDLEVDKTYWDRLRERLPRIIGVLLGFSLLLNARLLRDRFSGN
ncbi:MAG: hypothetical protein ABEJ07_00855 [Candidatus Nanohaloarchaea archaeon]